MDKVREFEVAYICHA